MNPAILASLVLAVALTGGQAQPVQVPTPVSPPVLAEPDEPPAVKVFTAALTDYMTLRARLATEIPPLTVTQKASEISAKSDALARGVQRARRRARQGEFFSPAVVLIIQQRLLQAMSSADRALLLSQSQEEPRPFKITPRIHSRFPEGNVLATTPSTVLRRLPSLPLGLEYRFIGNTLVLRDIDAALILDYFSPAIR